MLFYIQLTLTEKEKSMPPTFRKRVTLKDIADRSGVSSMTVSRVLNGKETRLARERIELIRKTAAELGYRPNASARALRDGRSGTIGLLIGGLAGRWQGCFIHALLNALAEHRYALQIASSNYNREQEDRAIRNMLSGSPDGMILHLSLSPENPIYQDLARTRFPLLLTEEAGPEFNTVVNDMLPSLRSMLCHIALRGHRRMAFLTNFCDSTPFETLSQEFSIRIDPVRTENNCVSQLEALRRIASSECTVLFAAEPGLIREFLRRYPARKIECVCGYSLPYEFIPDPRLIGGIVSSFEDRISLFTSAILRTVEEPDAENTIFRIKHDFLPSDSLKTFQQEQLKNPFYDQFLF